MIAIAHRRTPSSSYDYNQLDQIAGPSHSRKESQHRKKSLEQIERKRKKTEDEVSKKKN